MAGAKETGPVETTLFAEKTTDVTETGKDETHAKEVAATANQVSDCIEIGDREQTGNDLTYTPYGASTSKSIPGPATLGQFQFSFVRDRTDAKRKELEDASVGDEYDVVILQKTGSSNITYTWMRGRISAVSKTSSTGGPATARVSFSIKEGPKEIDAA